MRPLGVGDLPVEHQQLAEWHPMVEGVLVVVVRLDEAAGGGVDDGAGGIGPDLGPLGVGTERV